MLLFILNDKVIPDFHYRYRKQVKNIYTKNITALIEPGVFLENFNNYILYVSDMDGNKLKNIFIYEIDEKHETSKVTFAKRAEFITEGDTLKLKLEEGFRDETNPKNKKELYRLNFKIFFLDIPIKDKKAVKIDKKPSDMRLTELREKIDHFENMGIDPTDLLSEFHQRISFSFSIITFIILGFGVSLVVKHREKSINFGIAFLIAGCYYLLFILGETLIEYRFLAPIIGMWLPNVIICTIGSILLYKYAHT